MSLDKTSFPDGWKVVPISDVVFFQEGPGVRRFQYTDSGVKLLNGGNINKGILNLSTTVRYISDDEAYGKYNHFLVEEGDLLIACSGVVVEKFDGKIAYARKEHLPLCMNTSTMRFRSLDRDILHLDYFRWFLTTTYFKRQLQQLITGSAQLNFGPSHIKLMSIPLPPLETQKQIAAVLEKADQLRKDCQQMEQELNSLAQSVFIDMFGDPVTNPKGWDVKPLSSLGVVKGGLQVTSKRSVNPISVPYLRVANVYKDYLKLDEVKEIRVTDKELERALLKKGDILFVEGHGNVNEVGRSAVWNNEVETCVHQNHLIKFRPGSDVLPQFVSSFVNSASGRRQLLSMSKTTSGLNTLSASNISSLKILVPPIDKQEKYFGFNDSLLQHKEMNGLMLNELNEQFNALMQKAFKGELNLKVAA